MAVIKIYLSNDGENYTSTFENTLKEFSSICEKGSYQIPLGWSYGGTHKTNTFKVVLSGDPYYITEFEKYKHIKVTKDGTIVFLGSSPTFSKTIEKKDYFEATATYSDYSKGFEDQRFDSSDDWQWTVTEADGWKVCDGNNTAKSLVHYLFNKLNTQGLFTLHCDYTDTTFAKYFHVEGKDKVQRVFSEFLKQNALAYYVCNKDVYIIDVLENIQGTATTIPNIEGGATISEKPFVERKVPNIRFPHLTTKSGEQVYDSGEITVRSVASGDNFYPSSTTYATAECSYKDVGKDEEVVAYRNVRYNFWTQGSINPDLLIKGESRPTPEGARSGSVSGKGFDFMVDNDNWTLGRKFRLTFTATVDILSYANLVKPQDGALWDGDEKKCEYIFSTASANRYINALLYQKDAEAKVYNFYSDLDLALNSICVIQNVTKQAEFIRITDKIDNLDEFGGYTYKGVPYSGEGIVTDGQYVPVEYTAPSIRKDFDFTSSRASVMANSMGVPLSGQTIVFRIKLKDYIGTPTLTVNGFDCTLTRVTSETDENITGNEWTCTYTLTALIGSVEVLVARADLDGESRVINIDVIKNGIIESGYQYYISTSPTDMRDGDWVDELPESYTGYVWRRTKDVYADGTETYGEALYYLTAEDLELVSYTSVYEHGLSNTTQDPPVSFSPSIADTWQKGKYVWTREVRTYDSTGETVIGNAYYDEEMTKELLMSCRFSATPSSFTWNRDLRHTENVSITLAFNVVGYGDATPQVNAPQGVSVSYSSNLATLSFDSLIADKLNITVNLSSYPLEPAIAIKLSAVDTTERGIHFPVSNTKITSTTYVESGEEYKYVEGDYYLWRTTKTDDGVTYNDTLNPQYFDGTQWVDLIGIESKNTDEWNALLQLIPDVFQYANGENMLSFGDYSFFKNIIAQNISAEMLYSLYIQVGQAIYGGAFEANGTNPTGGQGFYLNRDGLLKAVNAILTNATITGTITHDALETVDAQYAGHLAGVTSGNYINANDLYDNLVSLNLAEGYHEYPIATNKVDGNAFNGMIIKKSPSSYSQGITRNTTATVTRDTAVTNSIVGATSSNFVAPFALKLRLSRLTTLRASYSYNTATYNGEYTYSGQRWESSTSNPSDWTTSIPQSQSRPSNPSVGQKYYTYTQTSSRTYYYWNWTKETTTGSWNEIASGEGWSTSYPRSETKPSRPHDGDSYTVVSNVHYYAIEEEYSYDYTVYQYSTETTYTHGSGSGTSVPSDTSTTTYTITDSETQYKYTTTTWTYSNYSETRYDGSVVSPDQTGEAEGYLEYRLNSGSWQRFNNDTVIPMAYGDNIEFRQTISAIADKFIYTKTGATTVSSVPAKWQEITRAGSAELYYDLSEYNVGFNFINKSGSALSVAYELSSANALYMAVSDCHVELTTGTDLITQLQKYSTFAGFTLGGSSTNGFFYRSFATGSTFKVAWETRGGMSVNLASANGVFLQFVNGSLNVIKDNAQFASLAVNDYVKTLEISADPNSIDSHIATKTLVPKSGTDTIGTEDDPYLAVFADNVGSSSNPSDNVYTEHLFFGAEEFTAITDASINSLFV